ncbi:MAG: hypothetical protein R6U61_04945 [Thermoplasmata archaeon]
MDGEKGEGRRKVFVCHRCKNQTCKIEVEVGKKAMEAFFPKYCPYSNHGAGWSETGSESVEDNYTSLHPQSIDHNIRNTGMMWVVETVFDYGKGFTRREDVKYFYNKDRAREEYDHRVESAERGL